jgi:hypothetical protein
VEYELLGVLLRRRAVAKQFAVSFLLNWVVGPALMTALAWACLPDLPGYRNGVIMVGLARCAVQGVAGTCGRRSGTLSTHRTAALHGAFQEGGRPWWRARLHPHTSAGHTQQTHSLAR